MKRTLIWSAAFAAMLTGCSKQPDSTTTTETAPTSAVHAAAAAVPAAITNAPLVLAQTNMVETTNLIDIPRAAVIKGTIVLGGKPPEPSIIDLSSIPDCSKAHVEPLKTKQYVVSAKNELKDVVVYLTGITNQSTGTSVAPLLLDQQGCEYVPFVAVVQTGQKIVVKNSDPVFHNVDIIPTASGNEPKNKAQAPGAPDITVSFSKPENFIRFKCDVHPWMFSYVTVLDNSFFAITAADGSYQISDVPPGKYSLVVIHRKAGKVVKEIEIKGETIRQDFTMTLPK